MNGDIDSYNLTLTDSRLQQPQITDLLEVIEKNEKMNEIGPDKVMDNASQLLSFDNKFYNFTKKLFDYNEY
jgi:hypothetical protein